MGILPNYRMMESYIYPLRSKDIYNPYVVKYNRYANKRSNIQGAHHELKEGIEKQQLEKAAILR